MYSEVVVVVKETLWVIWFEEPTQQNYINYTGEVLLYILTSTKM